MDETILFVDDIGMKGSVLDYSLVDLFLATVAIRQTRELP